LAIKLATEHNRRPLALGAVLGNTTTLPSQLVSTDMEEEGINELGPRFSIEPVSFTYRD
jgi:hypothetical protein